MCILKHFLKVPKILSLLPQYQGLPMKASIDALRTFGTFSCSAHNFATHFNVQKEEGKHHFNNVKNFTKLS